MRKISSTNKTNFLLELKRDFFTENSREVYKKGPFLYERPYSGFKRPGAWDENSIEHFLGVYDLFVA